MNTSANGNHENVDGAHEECELNVKCRVSFAAADEVVSVEHSNIKEDNGSTSSESTSTALPTRPVSTVAGWSFSNQTDQKIPCSSTYEVPQIRPTGAGVYQLPLIYNQQFQQGSDFPSVQNWVNAPVQVQPTLLNLPLTHQLQGQQVYSAHKYLQAPQSLVWLPVSSATVPYIMVAGAYPQQSNIESYQVSPSSVVSSSASPSVLNSFNTSDCSNVNGCIKTPVASSSSCTPIQHPKTYPNVLPMLNLDRKLSGGSIPQQISSNNNMDSVPSECPKSADAPAAKCPVSSDALRRQLKNELAENTEKDVKKRKEKENVWLGSCDYVEYLPEGVSNVFITLSGSKAELYEKLQNFKLEVCDILSTSDENVWNVIFESHPMARKAFFWQNLIRLRIVPPKNTHRN